MLSYQTDLDYLLAGANRNGLDRCSFSNYCVCNDFASVIGLRKMKIICRQNSSIALYDHLTTQCLSQKTIGVCGLATSPILCYRNYMCYECGRKYYIGWQKKNWASSPSTTSWRSRPSANCVIRILKCMINHRLLLWIVPCRVQFFAPSPLPGRHVYAIQLLWS